MTKRCRLLLALPFLLLFAGAAQAQQTRTLSGTVSDSSGLPIQGARIEFQSASGTRLAASDEQGKFSIPDVAAGGELFVSYPGFAAATLEISADAAGDHLDARLSPASTGARIIVTAAGTDQVPDEPSGTAVISQQDFQTAGTLALDDTLREAPGFTLLRRSSSLFANPTSQGVSLRGVGSNGASRTAVLLDGIPINDPFGSWVYWTQVPRVSIGSVEVLNGAGSDVYGTGALGGVVNIQSRPVVRSFASVEASYGNESTPDGSFDAGIVAGPWAVSATGQALKTFGYVLVPPAQRGSVDIPAGTGDLAGSLNVSRKLGQNGLVFVRGNLFGESRENGTPVTKNNTRMPSLDVGGDWSQAQAGALSLRVYGSSEVFNQTFSSVAANRNSESLTDRQRSPSQQVGFVGQWRRSFKRNAVTAGIEGRDVQGHSAETTFSAGVPRADVDAGGRQRIIGYFAQDAIYITPTWVLTLGGRVDAWLNSRGYTNSFALATSGPLVVTDFANRSQTAFSPRVALLHTFGHGISASASAYRGFRAPTLNELYRNFRVGNTQTNANPNLQAEILTGGEAGVSLQEFGERVTIRGNFFWSDIDNPVNNVPISYTPAGCVSNPSTCTLITQQRQNLGEARARGAEIAAEWRLPKRMQLSAEYLLTDSTVLSAPAQPQLVGLRVPQVPLNGFTAQFSWVHPKWTAGVQARYASNQFDDAANLFPLGQAFTMDAEVSRQIVRSTSLFFAAQNIFDDRYDIARTPITNIGPPALFRAGVRVDFP